jgi:hypothetical protein
VGISQSNPSAIEVASFSEIWLTDELRRSVMSHLLWLGPWEMQAARQRGSRPGKWPQLTSAQRFASFDGKPCAIATGEIEQLYQQGWFTAIHAHLPNYQAGGGGKLENLSRRPK